MIDLKDENGIIRGVLYAGVVVAEDSKSNEVILVDSDVIAIKSMYAGLEIRVASSNESATFLSGYGSKIVLDKPVVTGGKDYLLKGEILIFLPKNHLMLPPEIN